MNIIKQKHTDKVRASTTGYQWEGRMGEGQFRDRELRNTNYYI